MQERDEDLAQEDRMEKAGFFDWKNDYAGDLKAEFLNEKFTKEQLIQHFYWEEQTMEDFWNYNASDFQVYCEAAWECAVDVRNTENDLNRVKIN